MDPASPNNIATLTRNDISEVWKVTVLKFTFWLYQSMEIYADFHAPLIEAFVAVGVFSELNTLWAVTGTPFPATSKNSHVMIFIRSNEYSSLSIQPESSSTKVDPGKSVHRLPLKFVNS